MSNDIEANPYDLCDKSFHVDVSNSGSKNGRIGPGKSQARKDEWSESALVLS